jgi:hypothetical protein
MKKIRNFVLILALFVCFNGCEKNPAEVVTLQNNVELTIEQAKSFVENQRLSQFALKSGNLQKQTISIKADWGKAKSSNNDKSNVIETEILAMGRFGFATTESMDAWKATDNEIYLYSMSRLVVIKEKKTGEMYSFIMSVVADKPYFESKKFNLWDNTYLKREKDLTGYILFHSLLGDFVNGWVYCDGQIINSVMQPENLGVPIELKSASVLEAIYAWVEECTDWYTIGWINGEVVSFTHAGTVCKDILVIQGYYQVGGGSPGTGGGGYVPPTILPCNCTEICPICNKCVTVLKSASLPDETTVTTTTTIECEYCAGHPLPNIDIDGYNNLNSAEKELIKKYPLEAMKIAENKQNAEGMTINLFGYNGLNDCSDSFRHAYFQALNTISIGSLLTQDFSDAHESDTPIHLILEKQMDLHNNSIGINIGSNCYGCDLSVKIMETLRSGNLYFLSPINQSDPNFLNTHGITNLTRLVSTSNCN